MRRPDKITGANAGGPRQLPMRTHWAARVAQFWHWLMKTLIKTGSIVLIFTLTLGILADGQPGSGRGFCTACGTALISGTGSDFDADRLDSSTKVFHHYGIHSHIEAYLVCVLTVEKTGVAKNEMEIKSTIVDRINGRRTVGERFVFRRVSDASDEEVSRSVENMPGRLYYVFLTLLDGGHVAVDAQDPIAFWGYTEELREAVESHNKKCQLVLRHVSYAT